MPETMRTLWCVAVTVQVRVSLEPPTKACGCCSPLVTMRWKQKDMEIAPMVSSGAGKASETWALRSRRIVTPTGERDGAVLVSGESIADVVDSVPDGVRVVDVGELAVLPGLVDTHVHI